MSAEQNAAFYSMINIGVSDVFVQHVEVPTVTWGVNLRSPGSGNIYRDARGFAYSMMNVT